MAGCTNTGNTVTANLRFPRDDGMVCSPWYGVAAHRPNGLIMCVRKAAYAMSAKSRAEHNGQQLVQLRNLNALPT
jgi:hypothetical protein